MKWMCTKTATKPVLNLVAINYAASRHSVNMLAVAHVNAWAENLQTHKTETRFCLFEF